MGPNDLVIKNHYLGINASVIVLTGGQYKASAMSTPFDVGFEAAGEVAYAGGNCLSKFPVGTSVIYRRIGAFAEYTVVPMNEAFVVPKLEPAYVALVTSALTASICYDKLGELKSGDKVLVTAAAGGTGQFAVQLARLAGCHVIGTCSSDEKAEFLKSIGCHRPIVHTREDLDKVLTEEYPQGVDVVYESVGGSIFSTCVKHLALRGRLLLIGLISGYQELAFSVDHTLTLQLLKKSASLRGFYLPHFMSEAAPHISKLTELYGTGQLKALMDDGSSAPGGPFNGLEGVADAVDYIYTKKSVGKVIVNV